MYERGCNSWPKWPYRNLVSEIYVLYNCQIDKTEATYIVIGGHDSDSPLGTTWVVSGTRIPILGQLIPNSLLTGRKAEIRWVDLTKRSTARWYL